MAVGGAIRAALLRTTGSRPDEVFASNSPASIVMTDLVNDAAQDIAASYDWQAITRLHTISSGSGIEQPLPPDYERMLLTADVSSRGGVFRNYGRFTDPGEWLDFRNDLSISSRDNGWIILGGQMHFWPAVPYEATFPYISAEIVRDEDGSPKREFDADDDTFILSERLLTLGLVWRYKQQLGLDYAEDMQTYSIALGQAQARDGGSRVAMTPRAGRFGGVGVSYSGRAIR